MSKKYTSDSKKSFLIEELFNTSISSFDLITDNNLDNCEINILTYLTSFQTDQPDKNSKKITSENRNTYLNHFPENDDIKGIVTHNIAFAPYYQEAKFQIFPLWIFQKSKQSKQEKISNLNPQITEHFSQILALEYLEQQPKEGNLCFAQNIEVRDDFRTYFTPIDLLDYTLTCINSQLGNQQLALIYFPKDEYTFWQKVQAGKELRVIQQLKNIDVENSQFTIGNFTQETIQKVSYNDGQIFINGKSFISKISEWEWSFQIGKIKPIQKYLNDKVGTSISREETEYFFQYISAIKQMGGWFSKHYKVNKS